MAFIWDPRNIEIKTKSIHESLDPLVKNVTNLLTPQHAITQKQRSKKSRKVVSAVESAIVTFGTIGKEIARENPGMRSEINQCVDDVNEAGKVLLIKSQEFADNPLDVGKRNLMVKAARNLLSNVTKLLLFADYIDVQNLLKNVKRAEKYLGRIKHSHGNDELVDSMKKFQKTSHNILHKTEQRWKDLLDPVYRKQLSDVSMVMTR